MSEHRNLVSEYMLDSLERREANRCTGPSCAVSLDPNYISYINDSLEKVDPDSKEALRNAIEMLK